MYARTRVHVPGTYHATLQQNTAVVLLLLLVLLQLLQLLAVLVLPAVRYIQKYYSSSVPLLLAAERNLIPQ